MERNVLGGEEKGQRQTLSTLLICPDQALTDTWEKAWMEPMQISEGTAKLFTLLCENQNAYLSPLD